MSTALRRSPLVPATPYPAEFAQRYRDAGYWTDEPSPASWPARAEQFGDRVAVTGAVRATPCAPSRTVS